LDTLDLDYLAASMVVVSIASKGRGGSPKYRPGLHCPIVFGVCSPFCGWKFIQVSALGKQKDDCLQGSHLFVRNNRFSLVAEGSGRQNSQARI
jgi:hypothetical protein